MSQITAVVLSIVAMFALSICIVSFHLRDVSQVPIFLRTGGLKALFIGILAAIALGLAVGLSVSSGSPFFEEMGLLDLLEEFVNALSPSSP